jgi:hypothetical protein
MTNLSFDELKDKPKDELERVRLAQEIFFLRKTMNLKKRNLVLKVLD